MGPSAEWLFGQERFEFLRGLCMVTRFMQVDIGSIVSTATSFIDATVIGTSTFGAVKTVSVAAVLPDSVIFAPSGSFLISASNSSGVILNASVADSKQWLAPPGFDCRHYKKRVCSLRTGKLQNRN